MMIVNCDTNLKMVTDGDDDNAECDSDENSE